ncbi:RagB/SusD family nutrient uptake outer membrane protein [Niastella caeni]|uniref:RagB/SusD family nutrient uptake outer membrane protein n=1 Tax=Niastella caeni TaxID=2569763 RepID=A0A4S8HXQ2_9BACT|nr:RagB/SusD family nutrient uptake outer membrane protein [Niastella caeni]THU40467.1 RagB/SusD family nutrient uptake outer membrane protein [Niastella caeni]
MKYPYILHIILCSLLSITCFSCKKYLDEKPNQNLSTPETITDLQALLDNGEFYRKGAARMGGTAADEFYVIYSDWEFLDELRKYGYIWDTNVDDISDWNVFYLNVSLANTILDNWPNIAAKSPGTQADEIKGGALVHRANCFYQLAQIFAPQYDAATANSDLGIPLRIDADFNKPSKRASVSQTYDQIISDLTAATQLLPITTQYKTRPNRAAALAYLARVYLQKGDYSNARNAADQCLQLYATLIDYNDPQQIDTLLTEPFKNKGVLNPEIILYLNDEASLTFSSRAKLDTTIYTSYASNDIRRAAFARSNSDGSKRFKGSYNGSAGLFVGLGTAEVYLIRAEANARLGNKDAALQDLNTLLVKRFKTGTYVPITAPSAEVALDIILKERKKEMLYRGVRWSDIRRLNKEPGRAITLKRNLNGQIYTLIPNDSRYVFLIPQSIMQYSSLQQNPR